MSMVLGKKQKWRVFAAPAALATLLGVSVTHSDADPDAGLEEFHAL